MPRIDFVVRSPEPTSFRAAAIRGMFDLEKRQEQLSFSYDFPFEERPWKIGAIVGPSGSGKTLLARHCFAEDLVHEFSWKGDCLLDDFPEHLSAEVVINVLVSVGLSSAPAYLRPYQVLSEGQKARAVLARALAERPGQRICFDEFTSTVDRTVAKAMCVSLEKFVRRSPGEQQIVVVCCHEDTLPWLRPDWVFDTREGKFSRPPFAVSKSPWWLPKAADRAGLCFANTIISVGS